jgi:hypothetical protein
MKITPWFAVVLGVGVGLAAGCGKGKGQEGSGAAAASEAGVAAVSASSDGGAAAAAGGAAGGGAAAAPTEADTVAAEARAFLDRWLAAQNGRDFAAYAAMYDTKKFRGVKRTHGGKVKNYDGAGWTKDRKKMFDTGFTVAAEEIEVETSLSPGSKLKPGVASLRFLQRWKGGGYADHGIKVLQVWRDKAKVWHIVYEDLLNSEKGWERIVDEVADLSMPVPKDEAAALALWAQVKPTGADYEDRLSAIPDEEAIRRAMAIALLKQGDFVCKETVDSGSCGEEIVELAPLDDKADLANPCLRRRLALWALGQLDDADVPKLADELIALVKIPAPENELAEAAFEAVPHGETDDLRLQLIEAAIDADRKPLADEQVAFLEKPASVVAAAKLSLDAAVKRLDEKKDRAVLLAAAADEQLTVETREGVLAQFSDDQGKDVSAALDTVSGATDCGLAMQAIELLEARGDKSHLPQKPTTARADDYMRMLCLEAHDSNEARRIKRWQEVLAPKVVKREVEVNDFYEEEEEGEGEADDEPEVDRNAEEGEITETSGGSQTTDRWETDSREGIVFEEAIFGDSASECTGNNCTLSVGDGSLHIVFEPTDGGGLHITELETRAWHGCGC